MLLALAPCLLAALLQDPAPAPAAPQEPEASAAAAEAAPEPKLNEGVLGAFTFRSIGPALMSGRIADVAVHPTRPNVWYVAVGSGGVWKTENGGATFAPIFDSTGVYSIGCVTLDPHDPETVWVGTGEAVGGRHVGFGDGVYRSRDGGRSWDKMGLAATEHVAKIVVDPHDRNVIWVAAQGPLWAPGGERGLYKSVDGGTTWTCALASGPYTGCTDVLVDPRNPNVVYAALWQRHRTVWALMSGGPESGVRKSEDGGQTWRELRGGLPGGNVGKIGLALSPQDPDVVYATIELAAREGGFWRSADGGASWRKMSDRLGGGTGPHYYQELWADPHRFDCVYLADVMLGRTEDGGATWKNVENGAKHVDNHAVAFHPTDPDFLLVGCDGGLYVSRDRGQTYHHFGNLPVTQFYKVDVDYDWPVYRLGGGTQDNATQYGPARTLTDNGIRNADWRVLIGGDGHDFAIDPTNPNLIYCESQEGYLRRFDRAGGWSVDVRPQPEAGEPNFRFNWDAPILISPHDPARIWYASNRLFRSDDRGDSWTAVSPDLTRAERRLHLEVMGRTWSVDAVWDLLAMSAYSSITSVSESPLQAGLLYVGTDDGLVQVSEDGGATWRRAGDLPGEGDAPFFVNDVKADRFDANVVYVAADRHKTGDFAPYLFKSADRGRTWAPLTEGIPARHLVWRVIQDHEAPGLMFAGTEFGVCVTLDGGAKWMKMSGGLPPIPVRDLEIQRRENDLVLATFGRSFWVLDDYAPLRALSEEALAGAEFAWFATRAALLYHPDDLIFGPKGNQGDSAYAAENPPYGATFTWWIRDGWKTRKAEREKAEAEAAKAGEPVRFPEFDALRAEEREQAPALWLEVRGPDGEIAQRFSAAAGAGLHRATWDLRLAGGGLTTPGTHAVQAYVQREGAFTPLGEAQSFEVWQVGAGALPPTGTPQEIAAWQRGARDFVAELRAAGRALDEAAAQVREGLEAAGDSARGGLELLADGRALELALADAKRALEGDQIEQTHGEAGSPSIRSRAFTAAFGSGGHGHGPTGTQRRQLEIARADFEATRAERQRLLTVTLPAWLARLDAAGVPWTRGRPAPR